MEGRHGNEVLRFFFIDKELKGHRRKEARGGIGEERGLGEAQNDLF